MAKLSIQCLESKRTGRKFTALVYGNNEKKFFVSLDKLQIAKIGDMRFSEIDNMQIGEEKVIIEGK